MLQCVARSESEASICHCLSSQPLSEGFQGEVEEWPGVLRVEILSQFICFGFVLFCMVFQQCIHICDIAGLGTSQGHE